MLNILKKNALFFLFLGPLLGVVMAGINVYYQINLNGYDGKAVEFTIPEGEPFSRTNHRLAKADLIPSAKLFHRYVKFKDQLGKFKAGDYEIKKGDTLVDIAGMFVAGKTINVSVTIPEGKNIYEIADILSQRKLLKDKTAFLTYVKDPETAKKYGIEAETLEGYLYPDTYSFSKRATVTRIVDTMVKTFKSRVKDLDFSNPKYSKHQLIILASMVEKETGAAWERPRISGVFWNRLKKGMRLQSDPTTIYGMFETYDGRLGKKDLQRKTPYNTYRISGLPKGPITNPGIDAIKAALNPESHNYFYFVSQNDGTHIFSKDYRSHVNAVNKYQKDPKAREGKSWRDLKQ